MRDHLRSLWDEPRAADPPGRTARDVVLVAVLVPLAVLEGVLRSELVGGITVAALIPTLLWRRSHPLLVVAVAFPSAAFVQLVVPGGQSELFSSGALLLLVYALPRWGSGREILAGLAVVLCHAAATSVASGDGVADVLGGAAIVTATAASGLAFRYRAGERQRELERVRLREREQLARDLHDTVAHHMSAVAIRAQAGLATAAARPEAAVDALRLIEAEASRTLVEMRSIVRVLRRDDPGDRTPAPQLADLRRLGVGDGAAPPVAVELPDGLDDLPPAVVTAVHRIAQESVTNAVRHARHATRIEVHVTADDAAVHLRVHDDGAAAPPTGGDGGFGLAGMAERAGLLGGTCSAGPDPDGGWTVTAVLPRGGAT